MISYTELDEEWGQVSGTQFGTHAQVQGRCVHPSEVVLRPIRFALHLWQREAHETYAHCAHFGALVSGGVSKGQAAGFGFSGRNTGVF
jgi:hypothetical protein